MKRYEFKVVNKIDQTLVSEWKDLWENSVNASFFNSYEWFTVCLETYKIVSYKLLLCYEGKKLMALFPGVLKKRFGIEALTATANNEHIPGSPLLIRNYEDKLIKFVTQSFSRENNIFLSHVEERLTKEMKKSDKNIFATVIAKSAFIDLSINPSSIFSRSGRKEIERKVRFIQSVLDYRLTEVGEVHRHLDTMIAIDQGSAKKLKGGDTFSEKVNRDLFENLLRLCPGLIRIAYLYYQSRPIAYMFGFAYRCTFLEFHTAYLWEYAKLSPGKILFYKLLADLAQKSYKIFRFGMGFTGLHPEIEFVYDVYCSRSLIVRLWWNNVNTIRRAKQLLFHKGDIFEDYKFLFKTLK